MLGRDVIFHPCGWHIKELQVGLEAVKKAALGAWLEPDRRNLRESDLETALKLGSVPSALRLCFHTQDDC